MWPIATCSQNGAASGGHGTSIARDGTIMPAVPIQLETPPDALLGCGATFEAEVHESVRGGVDGSFAPAFEIREYRDRFEFEIDVPGLSESDLAVFITAGWVTIAGQRPRVPDSGECLGYRASERGNGTFWRAFRLSPRVTATGARATLERGVLSLSVPKSASLERFSEPSRLQDVTAKDTSASRRTRRRPLNRAPDGARPTR